MLAALVMSLLRAARPPALTGLRLSSKESLEGIFVDGERRVPVPLPESAVFRWLVVLRLRDEGRSGAISLAILPDQLSAEEFRVLRLWLRCHAGWR